MILNCLVVENAFVASSQNVKLLLTFHSRLPSCNVNRCSCVLLHHGNEMTMASVTLQYKSEVISHCPTMQETPELVLDYSMAVRLLADFRGGSSA